ncbi:MAG TPA: lysine--tRNA ligase [Spirochaetota bacterium]|jgi:lysyl-tRNA synthetase class 2|nr:lysine--tRNA ligase [Spirochaetota bacterium]HOK02895.1 lysine--tRNA ligase [Spirochaetota bacterium]HOK92356.1 lysine--tRNA ligase [Spirochaetota bacterium]HOQ11894.1 lysine--tRNA ligase [Spirochaetota bacterium]HPP94901.1 lysine--tRNA ligase [Spirochaetota bacterium]
MEDTNSLIKIRINKIDEIRSSFGINPFPYRYDVTHYSREIIENFEKYSQEEVRVSVAGRIMSMRVMGKASFCNIQDKDGRIQIYLASDALGEKSYSLFKKLDLGDIIGVKGLVKKTKMGEISVFADELSLLSKNVRPLPVVKEKDGETFDLFADKELRYRHRQVDLLVTPGVKETFKKRIEIIRNIKKILDSKDFFEVETPILQTVYGGASASPFKTHHNALDIDLYLRISLEPYLKRLIVGGFDRVYEIGKCFRNEGIDRTHNPEFTMLELYQAYADYNDMMALAEELIVNTAMAVNGTTKVTFDGKEIDLAPPWKKIKMTDAIKEYSGLDVMSMSDEELKKAVKEYGGEIKGEYIRGLAIDELFQILVEDKLIAPTFITHHPVETTPLCKPDIDDERFLQRFELFINGTEFANAYSESNDPVFQRKTLYEQSLRREVDDEVPPMDENFVQAIEAGMPPTGGMGIGIDRLVMLLTGENSIRDVLFFPTMRPE